jgi:ribosomal-protein-alanine N-acetyltransferase
MMQAPFLVGNGVALRALEPSDADGPYPTWFNDAEVCAQNAHHYLPYSRQDALEYIEQTGHAVGEMVLAIVGKDGSTHIGNVALKRIDSVSRSAEFAIVIGDRTAWGKGYGKEVGGLVLDHAFFALNLHRVYCGTLDTNSAMQRLAEHLGMVEEGLRRQAVYKDGRYLDIVEYGVLREEYVQRFGAPRDREAK